MRMLRFGKRKRRQEEKRKREQSLRYVLAALGRGYSSIYYADLDRDFCEAARLSENGEALSGKGNTYSGELRNYIETYVLSEDRETLLPLCDPQEMIRRFEKTKEIRIRYRVTPYEDDKVNYEVCFADAAPRDGTHKMVFRIRCVDEEIKEEELRRRTLQDALDGANRANAAKTEFLSKMSHDIRTPMNDIIGMTTIAAAHVKEPERVKDALAKISGASRHLLELINNILDMGRIEAGKMSLKEEPFDLPGMVNETVDMMQAQISAHRHSLRLNLWEIQHKTVVGDSLRIQQALLHLLDNAVKYTPDGGVISLTVREKAIHAPRAACFEMIVKDNGIGMPPEVRQKIFDPFAREEDQRTSKTQGSGLGLPITLNIVQMMNGSIEVESAPGEGSSFKMVIFLLLSESEEETAEDKREKQPLDNLIEKAYAGSRVLLAEDNPLNREIAAEILTMTGLAVDEAENGQEALTKFAESENGYYDMILMDIQMPVLNGHDAAREIRALERADAQSVPIVAMTASAFEKDIRASKAAGMNEHLSKPVDYAELEAILKKYLH